MQDLETIRSRMEREAIHRLQETLYNEILPFVVWKDVPECQERILAALVAFQEALEAIPVEDTRNHVSGLTKSKAMQECSDVERGGISATKIS